MSSEDQAARKKRAQRLRNQIKRLSTPQPEPKKPEGEEIAPTEERKPGESPRDFIQRKMREEAAGKSPGEPPKEDGD
jgi:hypothetical protein